MVHLAPAVVGPPDPGLVPRRRDLRAALEPPEGDGWERDPDVLDTWFSSALWPFATLGWPDDTPELRAFYPTDVLSTARDILFLWVARMVMMGLEFTGDIPFADVYVHSVIQAPDGRRMSKSLGTGIDPLDEIDAPRRRRGALRAAGDVLDAGRELSARRRSRQGQALANKLFNASRFVLLHVAGDVDRAAPRPRTLEDRWILSRLQRAKADAPARVDGFDFAKARARPLRLRLRRAVRLVPRARQAAPRDRRGRARRDAPARARETLALAHPVIPFVTEELWSHVPGHRGPARRRAQPEPDDGAARRGGRGGDGPR